MVNFGGDEVISDYERSGIVILPVPYDETSTWMKGADRGPEAIMEASVNLEFYDIETGTEVQLKGIHTLPPVTVRESPEALVDEVCRRVTEQLASGRFPVTVGGNHTVSIGAARAIASKFSDLTVLQLDAHADLRPEYEGSPLNHACAMARIREVAPVVQVGIRSMSAEEVPLMDRNRIFFAHELHDDRSLYARASSLLSKNVYITIDMDVFDPSLMPSTGTPEPGGPSWYDLMHFLRDVAASGRVVGFDIVELCPSMSNKAPDFIAAKVIYQLLSYIFR